MSVVHLAPAPQASVGEVRASSRTVTATHGGAPLGPVNAAVVISGLFLPSPSRVARAWSPLLMQPPAASAAPPRIVSGWSGAGNTSWCDLFWSLPLSSAVNAA